VEASTEADTENPQIVNAEAVPDAAGDAPKKDQAANG
jgi:hypothetical protein